MLNEEEENANDNKSIYLFIIVSTKENRKHRENSNTQNEIQNYTESNNDKKAIISPRHFTYDQSNVFDKMHEFKNEKSKIPEHVKTNYKNTRNNNIVNNNNNNIIKKPSDLDASENLHNHNNYSDTINRNDNN